MEGVRPGEERGGGEEEVERWRWTYFSSYIDYSFDVLDTTHKKG
jgi:hypothetical protein